MADTNAALELLPPNSYEYVLDKIAEALIVDEVIDTTIVEQNQKFIRNGVLQSGQGEGVLALFQKDVKANSEDGGHIFDLEDGTTITEFESLVDTISDFNTVVVDVVGTSLEDVVITLQADYTNGYSGVDITPLIYGFTEASNPNPINVSQFIPLSKQKSNVDVDKAEEYLDTNIFELLPSGDTRQERIIKLFQELNALLPPDLPVFDGNSDGMVDRDQNGNWNDDTQYRNQNSIQNNSEDGFVHRLKSTANQTNSTITIEDIYNTVLPYLTDILEDPVPPQDERREYTNKSSGYLQFRNLNQGIIIRNTNKQFVESLNPETQQYLSTGFTITTWVRFLDKVSEGTLFNFGNPLRNDDTSFGIRLETYVLNKDDDCPHPNYNTWGNAADDNTYAQDFFKNENSARFVRLIVKDGNTLRDSHIGTTAISNTGDETIFGKLSSGIIPLTTTTEDDDFSTNSSRLLNSTYIPLDFQEWYFLCVTFNHEILEDESMISGMISNSNFWMNNVSVDNPDIIVANSGYGNKCKVEIISKTDLLKSKGFKV